MRKGLDQLMKEIASLKGALGNFRAENVLLNARLHLQRAPLAGELPNALPTPPSSSTSVCSAEFSDAFANASEDFPQTGIEYVPQFEQPSPSPITPKKPISGFLSTPSVSGHGLKSVRAYTNMYPSYKDPTADLDALPELCSSPNLDRTINPTEGWAGFKNRPRRMQSDLIRCAKP